MDPKGYEPKHDAKAIVKFCAAHVADAFFVVHSWFASGASWREPEQLSDDASLPLPRVR